jgi:hypothetical protein
MKLKRRQRTNWPALILMALLLAAAVVIVVVPGDRALADRLLNALVPLILSGAVAVFGHLQRPE